MERSRDGGAPAPCILYPDRPACIGCGDCRCDLDPDKICDNCMRCELGDAGVRGILIDGIELEDTADEA